MRRGGEKRQDHHHRTHRTPFAFALCGLRTSCHTGLCYWALRDFCRALDNIEFWAHHITLQAQHPRHLFGLEVGGGCTWEVGVREVRVVGSEEAEKIGGEDLNIQDGRIGLSCQL